MDEKKYMIVYTCLSLYEAYRDRYAMFAELCKFGVEVNMLLLHGEHPNSKNYPEKFKQLKMPEGTSIITRRKYIKQILKGVDLSQKIIIHDTFVAQLGFYLNRKLAVFNRKKNVRNVLSLYSPNPGFIFEGHWLGYPPFKIKLSEYPYFLKTYVPTVIIEMVSCQIADMVVGNTQQIADDASKYYKVPHKKTMFIPAEVQFENCDCSEIRRSELELSEDENVILCVGNFQRRKGIDVAIEAFRLFLNQEPKSRLILLGEISDTGYLWFKKLLDHSPIKERVEMRPKVNWPTLKKYYRCSDIFLIPTRHEGGPRVVKEALACGLPVVASNVSGILAIDPDGVSVSCVNGWDPESYCEKMLEIIRNPEIRTAHIAAGEKIVQELSPSKIAKRYYELYESLFI